jgi:hypothetical protein
VLYQNDLEIVSRKRDLKRKGIKITALDLANYLNIPPSTVGGKISGFVQMSFQERKKILNYFDALEARFDTRCGNKIHQNQVL